MKSSLNKKINAGFAIVLTILALLSIFSVWGINKLLDALQWRRHTYEVIVELDETISALEQGETGAYGYIITGNDIYLKNFDASIEAVYQKVNDIARLTSDNPNQQHRIDILKPMIIEKNALTGELIDLWKNKKFTASDQWVLADREKIAMDNIVRLISGMKKEEYSLLMQRGTMFEASPRTMIFVIITGNLLAFTFAILTSVLINQDNAFGKPQRTQK